MGVILHDNAKRVEDDCILGLCLLLNLRWSNLIDVVEEVEAECSLAASEEPLYHVSHLVVRSSNRAISVHQHELRVLSQLIERLLHLCHLL